MAGFEPAIFSLFHNIESNQRLFAGLELNAMYDIAEVFSAAGITTGYGYTGNEIVSKIEEALGKKPGGSEFGNLST
jgi:hypothetical protein